MLIRWIILATSALALSPLRSQTPERKFRQSATIVLQKGCGNGLDENSAIGSCARVAGVAVTKAATGGHVCVQLPAKLKGSDVNLVPSAAVGTGAGVTFSPCGDKGTPGPCSIGWSRYEAAEYYPDTNRVCGRFKNWSADRDITVRIEAEEK